MVGAPAAGPNARRNVDAGSHGVNKPDGDSMILLTRREIEVVLGWKERVDWPDEKRIVAKLERPLETPEDLHLSAVQIGIIRAWVEEQAILRKVSGEQE